MKKTTWNPLQNWLLLVALPLALGAAFYRFFRSNRPFILGEGPAFIFTQNQLLPSTPSLLWSLALCSALLLVWKPQQKKGVWMVAIFVALISVAFERWQAAGFGRGTFDWNDCLFSLAGCLISTLFFQKTLVHEKLD
jgi:hypothetical protein